MIPFIIIAGIVLLYIATTNVAAPQTIDAAASSYTAPAAVNAVPYSHITRPSSMRTDSGQVTTSNTTTPANNHTGSVLAPSRPRDVASSSLSSSGTYVPPPASNPALERPEVRPTPVVTPEPRIYEAPVSVYQKTTRR